MLLYRTTAHGNTLLKQIQLDYSKANRSKFDRVTYVSSLVLILCVGTVSTLKLTSLKFRRE